MVNRMDANKRPNPKLNQLARTNEIEWKPLNEENSEGIWVKQLRFDPDSNRPPTIMLKFEPSARYPTHSHPAGEEIFVLEGSVRVGSDFLNAGDYIYTAPNNIHYVYSEKGCVLLLVIPEEVIILK